MTPCPSLFRIRRLVADGYLTAEEAAFILSMDEMLVKWERRHRLYGYAISLSMLAIAYLTWRNT